jgi:hypothetical protein
MTALTPATPPTLRARLVAFVDYLGTGIVLTYVCVLALLAVTAALLAFLPAPPSLGGRAFSYYCLTVGVFVGWVVSSIITPMDEADASRFSSAKGLILGVATTTLIASARQQILNNIQAAFSNPEFAGPLAGLFSGACVGAIMTYIARTVAIEVERKRKREFESAALQSERSQLVETQVVERSTELQPSHNGARSLPVDPSTERAEAPVTTAERSRRE